MKITTFLFMKSHLCNRKWITVILTNCFNFNHPWKWNWNGNGFSHSWKKWWLLRLRLQFTIFICYCHVLRENKENHSGLFMSPTRFLKTLFKFCVRVFELCCQQRELSAFLLDPYTTVKKCKYNQRNLGTQWYINGAVGWWLEVILSFMNG